MAEFEAGRRGPSVRSDCWIGFTPSSSPLRIEVKSKVESMYGDAIRRDARAALESLGIEQGHLEIEDAGALPFVLLSRIEAAVAEMSGTGKRLLPPVKDPVRRPAERERLRRSRLYLPGNEPKFMLNAGFHRPDGMILDLEDSVAPAEKTAARVLVRNALRTLDFGPAERMVRINQLPLGLEDLEEVVPENVHLILIPKCESAEQVVSVERAIEAIQQRIKYPPSDPHAFGFLAQGAAAPAPVFLMPILESALGILRAYEIATASSRIVALAIGLEDYTADLGVPRTAEGRESFFARSMLVNAARAAGVQAIDTVFSDVADMEGLYRSVLEARSLGFEGKGCIHPRQIEVVHRGFAPDPTEIEKARRIVEAYRAAEARGDGVVSLGSKMIDAPVVKRALATIRWAEAMGLAADLETGPAADPNTGGGDGTHAA